MKRAKQPWGLVFPRELEFRFQEQTAERNGREKLFLNLGAIALFDFFLFSDAKSYPEFFWRAVLIRVALFTPAALLLALISWKSRRRWIQEFAQLLGVLIAGLAVMGVVFGISETYVMLGQCGLLLITIYGTLVVRLKFQSALIVLFCLLFADAIFLYVSLAKGDPALITCMFLMLGCSTLALQASFRLERMERTQYLFLLREELRGQELSHVNRRLTDLTQVDALTGLANRRKLDHFLDEAWRQAFEAGSEISVMIVDLDHFKRVNDRAGHLYGDRILQRFADLLRDSVRLESDLATRFGGEEFAIVLPGGNEEMALGIAERLRHEVVSRNLALDAPVEGLQVTVSIGVATARPMPTGDPTQLIEAADAALYRAKSSGRNCVRAHALGVVDAVPSAPSPNISS